CHRRQQVQGREQSRQQLHAGQDPAPPEADRRERGALHEPTRHRRPPDCRRRRAVGNGAADQDRLKEKLAKLEEEVKRLAAIEKALLASPDKQISLTDPDCRSMATSGRGSGMVAYNVQSAVDTTNHLIVAHEVTNVGTDRSQLATMAQAAK